MRTVYDKLRDTDKFSIFVHIPKCAGTSAKERINQVCIENGLEYRDHDMHASLDSVMGYKNNYVVQLKDVLSDTGYTDATGDAYTFIKHPCEWYDSWFYYKKKYSKRHKTAVQPLTPLYSESGDYKEAIKNSFKAEHITKVSHAVLQNGFCPAAWMNTFDIGFYTAWFLYCVSDHKKLFNNYRNYQGDELITNCDFVYPSLKIHSTEDVIGTVDSKLSRFCKETPETNTPRLRQTKYEKNYIKCEDLLTSDTNLMHDFFWKERFMLTLFKKITEGEKRAR